MEKLLWVRSGSWRDVVGRRPSPLCRCRIMPAICRVASRAGCREDGCLEIIVWEPCASRTQKRGREISANQHGLAMESSKPSRHFRHRGAATAYCRQLQSVAHGKRSEENPIAHCGLTTRSTQAHARRSATMLPACEGQSHRDSPETHARVAHTGSRAPVSRRFRVLGNR